MAVHLCLEGVAGPLPEKALDLLQAAREEAERLQAMVEELLDLARLQAGKVELDREPVAAASLLRTAQQAMQSAASERQLALEVDELFPEVALDVDPHRVQLVFTNLIENAIRHSPGGGRVRLSASESNGFVRFEVSDQGHGVPPEHRTRVFEKFVRLPGAPAGGAGIGLSIARDVVRAHGGEIGVDEAPGGGARFWFTLPRVHREGAPLQSP
jgi:signal transduction histidine kinase